MKKLIALIISLSSLAFLPPLSAAPAANEVKDSAKTLQELNYKYEKLLQLNYARHQEIMKQLREIRELAKKPNPPVELPSATQAAPATAAPVSTPAPEATPPVAPASEMSAAPASTSSVESTPPAPEKPAEAPVAAAVATPSPEADAPAEPAAGASSAEIPQTTAPATEKETTGREASNLTPPTEAAKPAVETVASSAPVTTPAAASTTATEITEVVKEAKVVIPPEVVQGIHESESYAILAIIFSLISLASMGYLIFTVRKSDERIRRMLWKSEVDHLRDEVMGGRPVLKVEKSFDRLLLTNTGTVAADDIKLSLGPAPATMKQRLRVLTKIAAGEKAEVEIGAQTDNQVYGTLEYKNPENERSYKEQFMLKVDSVTGELVPIQQAV